MNSLISSYRLGDLVLLDLNETEKNEILAKYPNSIGSQYTSYKKRKIINSVILIQLLK